MYRCGGFSFIGFDICHLICYPISIIAHYKPAAESPCIQAGNLPKPRVFRRVKEVESVENNVIPIQVKKVVLHEHPDLDAIAAYWLALTFSQIGFLCIENAPIEFWSQGPPPDGRTAEEHEKEGTVCFDVGEGRFDHHPHGANGKPLDKCATDLVAEFLGVSNHKPLKQILAYVRMHDLEGPTSFSRSLWREDLPDEVAEKAHLLEAFSFIGVITNVRRVLKNEKRLIEWVCRQLTAYYEYQVYFWTTVAEEFLKKAKIWVVFNGTRTYKIATIESDIREAGAFSRTRDGGSCAACIHRVPKTGCVFISGNISSEQFLELGKILRVWEMKKRGITKTYDLSELSQSKMEICPIWYLPINQKGEVFVVMNGGEKATSVEPTVLPLEWIEVAMTWALDERILSPQCPRTHCLYDQCNFYPFGLTRCKRIRAERANAA
jgi:hypothetical protein